MLRGPCNSHVSVISGRVADPDPDIRTDLDPGILVGSGCFGRIRVFQLGEYRNLDPSIWSDLDPSIWSDMDPSILVGFGSMLGEPYD